MIFLTILYENKNDIEERNRVKRKCEPNAKDVHSHRAAYTVQSNQVVGLGARLRPLPCNIIYVQASNHQVIMSVVMITFTFH